MADDEQQYGELSHGYPSERLFEPKKDPEPLVENDDRKSIQEVADHISERWKAEGRSADSERPIIDRSYVKPDGSPVEPDKIVSVKENAEALGKVYERDSEQQQQQADVELTNQVDEARTQWHYENNPEFRAQVDNALAQQQQQPEQPQSQPQQPETPESSLAAKWQALDPEVRTALEQQVQQVEAAQKQFAEAAHEAARVSAASIFAQYPELAGLSSDQINGALAVLSRENPQKFLQIQSQIAQAKHYYDQSQQYRAAEQQRAQQKATSEFSQYVQQQDAIFEDAVAKEYGAEKVKAVKGAVWDIAQEAYGLSKEQLQGLWNTQPLLRTAAMQKMFFDAAAFQMAKKGVAHPDKPQAPPVQRPGVAGQMRSGDDGEIAALTRRAAKTGSVRDHAALRLAKMQRQNRG